MYYHLKEPQAEEAEAISHFHLYLNLCKSDAKKTAACKLIEAELFNFTVNDFFKSETPVCANIG